MLLATGTDILLGAKCRVSAMRLLLGSCSTPLREVCCQAPQWGLLHLLLLLLGVVWILTLALALGLHVARSLSVVAVDHLTRVTRSRQVLRCPDAVCSKRKTRYARMSS